MKIEGLDYPHIPGSFPLKDFLRDLDEQGTAGRHATALTFVDRFYKAIRESVDARFKLAEAEARLQAFEGSPASAANNDWLM